MDMEHPAVGKVLDLCRHLGSHPVPVHVPKALQVTFEPKLFDRIQAHPEVLGAWAEEVEDVPPIAALPFSFCDSTAHLVEKGTSPGAVHFLRRRNDARPVTRGGCMHLGQQAMAGNSVHSPPVAVFLESEEHIYRGGHSRRAG